MALMDIMGLDITVPSMTLTPHGRAHRIMTLAKISRRAI
jgi:hypothetical protein